MTKTDWSKENLSKIIAESYSNSEVIRALGLKPAGGNFSHLKKCIEEYQLDTSHFTGARWHSNPKLSSEDKKLVKLEDILRENTNYGSDYLKKRLIAAGIKEYKCEKCNSSEWNGKPIPLELHHINGNHYDNRLENLQILCHNCHAQTNNFRSRNKCKSNTSPERISKSHVLEERECPVCHKIFKPQRKSQKFCSVECARQIQQSSELLSKDTMLSLCEKYNNIAEIANVLNVSRPTVRKYLERYDLLESFKSKFDFRAIPVAQFDLNGNKIKEWPSISDAEQTLNIRDIGKCVNFQRKSAGGYIWRKL